MRAVIAANSQIRWSPIERTLLLDRGTIDIDVDAIDQVAHVITPSFDVEVADAALTVEASAVRVHRGSARIVDRRGKLLAQLEAEGSWEPSSSAAPRKSVRTTPGKSTPESAAESAADLLARARDQFAAKQYDAAERLAERALAIADARSDQADAQIFLADVAQAAGKLELAVSRYETVATKFAELPAAESALYAGARIELRRGRLSEARILLDRYLDRYPTGRYADDARRQRTSSP
jgi:tetratricopeptide (TPR) repeat protein